MVSPRTLLFDVGPKVFDGVATVVAQHDVRELTTMLLFMNIKKQLHQRIPCDL